MKNLLFLFLLPIVFGSCKTPEPIALGNPPTWSSRPYVRLKDGTMIDTKSVVMENKKLITDSATYHRKKVAEFSTDGRVYASVFRTFVPQKYSGNINVYEFKLEVIGFRYNRNLKDLADYSRIHTYTGKRTYLQKAGTTDFYRYKYKSINKLIDVNEPGYDYLRSFRKNRIANATMTLGGIALLFWGATIADNATYTPGHRGAGIGTAMFLSGPAFIAIGIGRSGKNGARLERAIAKHNGLSVE